ncbi:MAG TPA: putative glycoside hydrolase [Longimicrobiales bacterium]|nr:putative glycoside hydrolase [Longimicrobiales bacterium]
MRKAATFLLAAAGLVAGACGDAPSSEAGLPAAGSTSDSVTIGDPPLIDTAGTAAAAHVRAVPAAAIAARAPSSLRGIYLNAYAAGSTNRLNTLLALADTTEINAFVIDVKDERGIRYRSGIELAMELAQAGEVTIRDIESLATRLRDAGVWSIARIVLFKDPILSEARPGWSIRTPDGAVWRDREGHSWVSVWSPEVWDYNLDIAEEVARAGFDEIQFDYVRFPEAFRNLPEQVHPGAKGTRSDAIATFLAEARRRLHPHGVVVAADVFGLSPNDPRDVAIGQQWETVLAGADHVLPMVYPSHYFPTHLRGVPRPNRMPYETVFTSLGLGMIRWERLLEAGVQPARVIPWLQAFNAPWVDRDFPYGPEQADAQIRAVYDVGLDDWIFWHPGSRYEQIAAAFARETVSRRRPFSPSADFVAQADLLDRQGAKAARDAAAGRTPPDAAPAAGEAGGT